MKRKKDLFQSWIDRAELKSREFGKSPEEDNTEQSLTGDSLVSVTHSSESQVDNNSTTSAGQQKC